MPGRWQNRPRGSATNKASGRCRVQPNSAAAAAWGMPLRLHGDIAVLKPAHAWLPAGLARTLGLLGLGMLVWACVSTALLQSRGDAFVNLRPFQDRTLGAGFVLALCWGWALWPQPANAEQRRWRPRALAALGLVLLANAALLVLLHLPAHSPGLIAIAGAIACMGAFCGDRARHAGTGASGLALVAAGAIGLGIARRGSAVLRFHGLVVAGADGRRRGADAGVVGRDIGRTADGQLGQHRPSVAVAAASALAALVAAVRRAGAALAADAGTGVEACFAKGAVVPGGAGDRRRRCWPTGACAAATLVEVQNGA